MARGMALLVAQAGGQVHVERPARTVLRIFADGKQSECEPDPALLETAWVAGSLPGHTPRGKPLREDRSEGIDFRGRRTLRVEQEFADGVSVVREIVLDRMGEVVAVRLYHTAADGARCGFRLEGMLAELPLAILALRAAFAR